jgi:predicted Zn-dependent protease
VASSALPPTLDFALLSRWIKPLGAGGWSDLFFEWKSEIALHLRDGEIEDSTVVSESGVSARARRENRVALAASSRADETGAREAIRTLAGLLPSSHYPKSTDAPSPEVVPDLPDPGRWARKISSLTGRVLQDRPHRLEVRRRQASRGILTGDRPPVFFQRLRLSITGSVLHDTAGGPRWRPFHFHLPEADDGAIEEVRRRLRQITLPSARPVPPVPATVDVLFENGSAAFFFHEVLSHPLEADAPASRLAGLAKARLAPREIEVADEPSRLDLFGGYSADDEGLPARRTPLLSAGHLAGSLRDRFHSDPLHPSTANGRRAGPFEHAAPRGSNIVIGAGGASEEEMLHRLAMGIRIEEFDGGSVDPASGTFRLRFPAAQSVVRGRPAQALGAGCLEGEILEALGAIDPLLGSHARPCRELGWCARDGRILPVGGEAPTLIVRRLRMVPA